MTTIQEVNRAIMFGQWTDTELSSMIDAIKFARSCLQKQVKRSLSLGDTVRWTSSKNPRGEQGSVTKIARKFVTVRTQSGMMWRVPANMLEVV